MSDVIRGLKIKTSLSLAFIEEWLENHCFGDFRVAVDGISEDLSMKEINLYFELRDDKLRFKNAYLGWRAGHMRLHRPALLRVA